MAFSFCWEHFGCAKECKVRDLAAIFCWRVAISTGRKHAEECERCAYRQAWVRGELSMDDFVRTRDRRASPRTARRVLVVDDEPNILFALEETVRDLGFECIAASDGEDALVIARGARPDLIITDVIMPRLNGFELCEKLKAEASTSGIPVVMVTVRSADQDRKKGSLAGADAYLVKPFHITDLKLVIDALLLPRDTGGSGPGCEPPPDGQPG